MGTTLNVIFIVLMTLLVRKTVRYVGESLGKQVFRRHKDAELIIETRRVPPEWYEGWARAPEKARGALEGPPESEDEQKLARTRFVDRLDELVRYFRHAPVFENDMAKQILLEELAQIRSAWMEAPWTEIVPRQEKRP